MAPAGIPTPAERKPEYEIGMKLWQDEFVSCTCSEVRTSEQPKPGPNTNSLSARDMGQLLDIETHMPSPSNTQRSVGIFPHEEMKKLI